MQPGCWVLNLPVMQVRCHSSADALSALAALPAQCQRLQVSLAGLHLTCNPQTAPLGTSSSQSCATSHTRPRTVSGSSGMRSTWNTVCKVCQLEAWQAMPEL